MSQSGIFRCQDDNNVTDLVPLVEGTEMLAEAMMPSYRGGQWRVGDACRGWRWYSQLGPTVLVNSKLALLSLTVREGDTWEDPGEC